MVRIRRNTRLRPVRVHVSGHHKELLRTNLWLVPAIEVLAAIGLFAATNAADRAAYHGSFAVPSWVISGSADAARQILTTVAAAIITVVGVVFSILIVALTLVSTQFGPRMLRTFIRDRGTQLTLGTFVATFVYAVLTLVSIGGGAGGPYVPHIGITVTLALTVADLAVLIYFIHHIATQIQLPEVIAGISADLSRAIDEQMDDEAARPGDPPVSSLLASMPGPGGMVHVADSGYLQYIHRRTLLRIAANAEAVIYLRFRPGHFMIRGSPLATVWPASATGQVADELTRAHVTGPYRTLAQDVSFGIDQLVEIAIRSLSSAVNDTFTAMTCIDWLSDSLCKVAGRWRPARVHRDRAGTVRVITTEPAYDRLVSRSFEKIRQSSRGLPAVLIRLLDGLTRIMERTTAEDQRQVLLDQAAMIIQASEESVLDEPDRADVRRRYQALLAVHAQLTASPLATPGS
jgi:uncharacterized membrane protein